MSYVTIGFLWFLVLWLASAWLYVGYHYVLSRWVSKSGVQFRTSQFFVRQGQRIHTSVSLKLDSRITPVQECCADVCLLIDHSASMRGESSEQTKWGSGVFIENAKISESGVQVGVALFNHHASVAVPICSSRRVLRKGIKNLPRPSGSTNLLEGLKSAASVLNDSPRSGNTDVKRYIIILTDGATSEPDETLALAEELKAAGIILFCIGIKHCDQDYLERLAGSNSEEKKVFYTEDPEQLASFFDSIRDIIEGVTASQVNVGFDFNHDELVYLGTDEPNRLSHTAPMNWFLPVLKADGETIWFKSAAVPCMGRVSMNLSRLNLTYQLEQEVEKTTEQNSARCSVIVIPWLPPWAFVSLVNPVLWKFFQRKFCPSNKVELRRALLPEFKSVPFLELPSPQETPQQGWHPTLCLGLGGAGIAAALRFKSLVMDAQTDHGELQDSFRFLNIDTEQHKPDSPQFGLATMAPDEFICIGADMWSEHLASALDTKRNPWYPHRLNSSLDREIYDTRTGCSGNRYLGRLSLHNNLRDSDQIPKQLMRLTQWLSENDALQRKVIVFCASSGGTGSAIYSDVIHLLLSKLEDVALESQTADLVIPAPAPAQTEGNSLSGAQTNETGFMLELERLKTIAGLTPDLADYPGARPLNVPRFTHMEYLVKASEDYSDSCLAAACLGLTLTNVASKLEEEVVQSIVIPQRSQPAPHSIVSVTCAQVSFPLFASERYLESKFLLDLLADSEGIVLGNSDTYILQADINQAKIQQQLLTLFTELVSPDLEPLSSPLPYLFNYMVGMSSDANANANANGSFYLNLLVGALERKPDFSDPRLRQDNLQTACVRLLEWVYRNLQAESGRRLARTVVLIEAAEKMLFDSINNIQAQSIDPTNDVEVLLLFRQENLHQINELIYDYINIVQLIRRNLLDWSYLLSEGLPMTQYPRDKSFYGLARRYHREQALSYRAIEDYQVEGYGDLRAKLDNYYQSQKSNIPAATKSAIKASLVWDLDPKLASSASTYTHLIESSQSPFIFRVTNKNNDLTEVRPIEQDQQALDKALKVLAMNLEPWLSSLNDLVAMKPPIEPSIPSEKLEVHYSCEFDQFARGTANIMSKLSAAISFRDGLAYKTKAKGGPTMRGYRNHVLKPDAEAAIIQTVFSKKHPTQSPAHPLVSYLMEDMHRLQQYIYLLVDGKLIQRNHPERQHLIWAMDVGGSIYYLSHSIEAAEFEAAIQFVLKKNCLLKGSSISVPSDWRPSNEDIDNLKQALAKGLPGHLSEFTFLITVMTECEGGYVSPFEQLSNDYLYDMLTH